MKPRQKPAKPTRALPAAVRRLGHTLFRRHSAWLVALCAAAVVLTMGAPAALFAVSDEIRFARAENAGTPYQSRTVEGDDLYLVRALKERSEAEITSIASYAQDGQNDTTLYLGGQGNDLSQMQYSSMLAPHCQAVLTALQESGTINEDWLVEILDAAVSDPYNFYGVSDTMGFLTFGYFPNRQQDAQRMSMTVESRTGKMVSLQLLIGFDTAMPDPEPLLRAWMEQNDLDILGDWTVPTGTRWESSGLYSARGGLLATCITTWDNNTGSYALSLDLVPCTEEQLQAAAIPLQGADSDISDDQLYTGRLAELANQYFNDGSSLLYPQMDSSTGNIFLRRLDYDSMVSMPVCTREGCTHTGEDCPAWLCNSDGGMSVFPFSDGGTCYAMVLNSDNTAAQILALDGSRHWQLATVTNQGLLSPLGTGNGKLYLAGYANENVEGCQPSHILVVDLQTGAVTASPALIRFSDQVVGCYGGCLVLVQSASARADRNGQEYRQYWGFLYSLLSQDSPLMVTLLDPDTGARRLVSYLSGNQLNLGRRYTADEWIFSLDYIQYSADDSAYSVQNNMVFALNMRTGAMSELTSMMNAYTDELIAGGNTYPEISNLNVGEMITLSSLAGEDGPFSKDLLYLSVDGSTPDLLLNPESGTLEICTPSLSANGWYPCAVTGTGNLIVTGTRLPYTVLGMIRLEDLVLAGSDVVQQEGYS